MDAVVILLAAGSGERLGADLPKAFVPLGERPMLELSLRTIAGCPHLGGVVLVVPPSMAGQSRGRDLVRGLEGGDAIRSIVPGGDTRQDSVRLGLAALPPDVPFVLCHDAARPFASARLFVRVLATVAGGRELDSEGSVPGAADGAVPVIPMSDTVKRLREGWVVETLAREEIALAQTPQAFVASALRSAHGRARPTAQATDDATLLEAAGFRVAAVEGEATNFKVTTADDLRRAEEALGRFLSQAEREPL